MKFQVGRYYPAQMTLPKKGLRKITVETNRYAWSVTGNDGGLHLSVIPLKQQDNLLTARFDYHSRVAGSTVTAEGVEIMHLKQQFLIAGLIVRRVIVHAINEGWDPRKKGMILNLGRMEVF
ncbi:hypothetical protein [Chitinophaga ginsengisegetis]|uniref:hypothetical protein n=1 Tax=Chitinophaga ginsengisegetis TaxID=393003 RepID=UPI00105825F5|nr:hypothetical protein [Chitinophaga ginsengisegetis]MDR6568807.1 hypothetical protein [Chitinophaga ginsengisegetis]MDR6647962.1 hypothetical protein [Chitinophaga ginsengisegetis]MDR6654888.1 hypothetical protein [Chitinophaga ginsengisegetis]